MSTRRISSKLRRDRINLSVCLHFLINQDLKETTKDIKEETDDIQETTDDGDKLFDEFGSN